MREDSAVAAVVATDEQRGSAERWPSPSSAVASAITVVVRKRCRISGREDDETDVVRCDEAGGANVTVYESSTKLDLTPVIAPSSFSYDHVFDEASTNTEVYAACCQPLLQSVRDGGGAVIFAFGQTGSGKTFTMLGKDDAPGIYGLAVTELLTLTEGGDVFLSASFYEVYGSKLYDLLNDRAEVKMLQDEYKNVHIVGLTEQQVRSVDDVNGLMARGQQLRAIGTTHANDRSSRSHAVLEIKLKTSDNADVVAERGGGGGAATPSLTSPPIQQSQQQGRITFVDLAGSERASDTAETDAKTRREGAEINKSLLALKECIRAMLMRKRHIPFRGSKLTQILRESFVGRCRTCVIATVSPCQSHCEDTLNTLRYADRIKGLRGPANPQSAAMPIPCRTCGQPIFVGDRHVCKRLVVTCPHCRQECAKHELEQHMSECKDAPMRCPHCNERMLRGEFGRHGRRCPRMPLRCPACAAMVPRQLMDRHTQQECVERKAKCRHCGAWQTQPTLATHEQTCEAKKVTCPYCLQYFKERRLEAHVIVCLRNPNRPPMIRSAPMGSDAADAPGASLSLSNAIQPHPSQERSTSSGASSPREMERFSLLDRHLRDGVVAAAGPFPRSYSTESSLITEADSGASGPTTAVPTITSTTAAAAASVMPPVAVAPQRAPGVRRRCPSAGAASGVGSTDDGNGGVVCPYARYGCPVKVTRLNVAAHLHECVQRHLNLVTTYADRVDEQNIQLRRLVVQDTDMRGGSWAAKPQRSASP